MSKEQVYTINDLIRFLRNIARKRALKILFSLSSLNNKTDSIGFQELCVEIRENADQVRDELKRLETLSLINLTGEGVKHTGKGIFFLPKKPRRVKLTEQGWETVELMYMIMNKLEAWSE